MSQGMRRGMRMRVRTWALALAMVATLPATAAGVSVPRAAYTLQADVQGDGPVAVVFESGFGQGAGVWKAVVDGLGAECRCIAYGRAGLDGSGTDGNAKTIDQHLNRKSTRLNSSHVKISYAVFCLKKKKRT